MSMHSKASLILVFICRFVTQCFTSQESSCWFSFLCLTKMLNFSMYLTIDNFIYLSFVCAEPLFVCIWSHVQLRCNSGHYYLPRSVSFSPIMGFICSKTLPRIFCDFVQMDWTSCFNICSRTEDFAFCLRLSWTRWRRV